MLFWLLLLFRTKIILEINKFASTNIFHRKNHYKRPLTTLVLTILCITPYFLLQVFYSRYSI